LINENGRFNKPRGSLSADAAKAAWEKYDSGLYVNCILKDYVRTILSLNRPGTT